MKYCNRAFTLTELIVTIVIIGILVGLALPQFTKTFETTKAKEAVAALRQIRTGERIYRLSEDFVYPSFTDPANPVSDIATVNANLKSYIDTTTNRNWDYEIRSTDETRFTITATRRGGRYNGRTIIKDETGQILPASTWPLPLPAK